MRCCIDFDTLSRNLLLTVGRVLMQLCFPICSRHADDYYNPKFRFCEPKGGPKAEPESLGSILFGDRIFNSPYDVRPTPPLHMPATKLRSLDQNA